MSTTAPTSLSILAEVTARLASRLKRISDSRPPTQPKQRERMFRPGKCPVCGLVLTVASNVPIHMRVHTGEKPYKCTFCSKCFAQIGTLNQHERIHTNEKPFKCDLCPKAFARQGDQTIHRRSHTGERPYQCTACSKSFVKAGHLRVHERLHKVDKLAWSDAKRENGRQLELNIEQFDG